MATVPDHLVPTNGVSDAAVRFAGYEARGRAMIVHFEFSQGDRVVGTFSFTIDPAPSIDSALALARQKMNDALRQMLYENELSWRVYLKRSS